MHTPLFARPPITRRRDLASRSGIAAVVLALLCVLPLPAAAQDAGQVVLAVGDVRGTPSGAAPRALGVGDGFALGYAIATGDESEALLTFDPRGSLRLYSETQVTVDRALVDNAGRADSRLSVLVGRLRVALGSLFSGDLEIETPTATVGIKGTELLIGVAPDGTTLVAVFEGVVTVTDRTGNEITLTAGFRTMVRPGARSTPPAPIDFRAGQRRAAAEPPQLRIPGDLYDDFPDLRIVGGPDGLTFPPDPRGSEIPDQPPPRGNGGCGHE